jgi:glutaredoxin-related protein
LPNVHWIFNLDRFAGLRPNSRKFCHRLAHRRLGIGLLDWDSGRFIAFIEFLPLESVVDWSLVFAFDYAF